MNDTVKTPLEIDLLNQLEALRAENTKLKNEINLNHNPITSLNSDIKNDLTFERHKLELIFKKSPAAMAFWRGPTLIFEKVNSNYQEIYGQRELIGKPITEALPELVNQPFPKMLLKVFQTGEPLIGKEVLAKVKKTEDSEVENRYYDFTYTRIDDKDGNPYGVFNHALDVTDRVRSRLQLENAKKQAERANAIKSEFLANMSHEIRTPLSVILGTTELMKLDNFDHKKYNDHLNTIKKNGQSLTKIIDDILDISKIEADQLVIDRKLLNLKELICEVVNIFKEDASLKGIKLTFDDTNMPDKEIVSDAVRIKQILINLIGNAIKFTPKGEVTIFVEYEFLDLKNLKLSIFVRDTGIGLSWSQAALLFNTFTQVDNTSTRNYGGTGLGLALSRKLGVALGGNVIIQDCELDKGCTFRFDLITEYSQSGQEKNANLTTESNLKAKKVKNISDLYILIVDDSKENRRILKTYLSHFHATIDTAINGAEGTQKALSNDYDVVLMDIQMPEMDGYEALEILKRAKYSKPIIAVTAHAMKEEREKALKIGFSGYLTKPINYDLLVDLLSEI